MITQQQLIDNIRVLISERDPTNSFVLDPDIVDIINRNIPDFSRDVLLPKTKITITTSYNSDGSPQSEVLLKPDVLDVVTVFCNILLDYVSYEDYLDTLDLGIVDTPQGDPCEWYLREELSSDSEDCILVIGFSPTPNPGTNIDLQIVEVPTLLTGSQTTLPYPLTALNALSYKVIFTLMESDKKFDQATYFERRYEDEKTKLKLLIQNRVISYVHISS